MTTTKRVNNKRPMDDLEENFSTVETLRTELTPAEQKLDASRDRMQQLLGTPGGGVNVGPFRFSKVMVIIGGVFAAFLAANAVFGLGIAFMFAIAAGAAGALWLRAKF